MAALDSAEESWAGSTLPNPPETLRHLLPAQGALAAEGGEHRGGLLIEVVRHHTTGQERLDLRPARHGVKGQAAVDHGLLQQLHQPPLGPVGPATVFARQLALAYRTHLLRLVSPATAKTRLAYLSGLFSVLAEARGEESHALTGVAKRIKTTRTIKEVVEVRTPTHPALLLLFFSGARLAEIAGLRAMDLQEDRILIRPNKLRPLKTAASTREIPIHPTLVEVVAELRRKASGGGHLFPGLYSEQHQRWGMGLQDVCRRECGVSPKGLRDRAATVLRSHGLNEAVAARLLGHTPSWITASYGGVPWEKLVEAVALL